MEWESYKNISRTLLMLGASTLMGPGALPGSAAAQSACGCGSGYYDAGCCDSGCTSGCCDSGCASGCGESGCASGYYGEGTLGLGDMTGEGMPPAAPSYDDFAFSGGSQGSVGNTGRVYGGYIDSAIPMSQVRFRFDASFDFLQPDRAEFFYAACGCAGGPGPGSQTPLTVNSNVDSQEFGIYLESARSDRFSWFVELPFRRMDPEANNLGVTPVLDSGISSGLADMNAGFKHALIAECDRTITFQFRVYAPTGDADRGLGNNHVSLEPAILYQRQLSERVSLFGEVRDWIPIDGFIFNGDNFAGNVLRYGAGIGYTICDDCKWKITPMAEFVGWSILDGQMTDTPIDVTRANGTIVNAKLGVRIQNRYGLGCRPTSLYVGYGRALTGDTWYQDIVRVDYSVMF